MQRFKRYLTPSRLLYVLIGLFAFVAFTHFVTGDHAVVDKYLLAIASLYIGWYLGQAEIQERARAHLRRRAHGDT